MIDILVQTKRHAQAAIRFFSRLVKTAGATPRRLVTDKLRSYPVAHKTVIPDSIHDNERYSNNRAEVSHQPTRQHEPRMRRFKSMAQAQRFLTIQGAVQNLFNIGRHLLRANNYRLFRLRAFVRWQQATYG